MIITSCKSNVLYIENVELYDLTLAELFPHRVMECIIFGRLYFVSITFYLVSVMGESSRGDAFDEIRHIRYMTNVTIP